MLQRKVEVPEKSGSVGVLSDCEISAGVLVPHNCLGNLSLGKIILKVSITK